MTKEEKIKLLEETFEVDDNTLNENTVLSQLEEYDSIAKLSLIVLFEDTFNKRLNKKTIDSFVTVSDILGIME